MAGNRRDVEAVAALWDDPEGVWYPALEEITEGRTYRGHAGVRQYFEDSGGVLRKRATSSTPRFTTSATKCSASGTFG